MSDGPTHFKNEVLRQLSKALHTRHHFTTPYCPWNNGAVERLGKELLRVSRAILSELQLQHTSWPDLVPMFQLALNNSPSPQRNNTAPLTAFTRLEASPPIATFLRSATAQTVTLTQAQQERCVNISELVKRAEELHPIVQCTLTESRRRMREQHAKGKLPNFIEGDFVLVAREDFHKGEKLCLRWRGP